MVDEYVLYVEEGSLEVPQGVSIPYVYVYDEWKPLKGQGGRVVFHAEGLSDPQNAINALRKLANIALSGRMVVIQESDDPLTAPPVRYVVTPGRITREKSAIKWSGEKEAL